MNKHPFLICLSCLLFLLVLFTGFLVAKRFLFEASQEDDYDAEVDESSLGNSSTSTLWDLNKEIKTRNHLKVYLFNVENTEEVLRGERPILREVGPYHYDQQRSRVTLGIYEETDSVRYKDKILHYFNPSLSKGKEDDVLTIINVPWVGLAQEVSNLSAFSRLIVMAIVSRYSETVFMSRPVSQLLFGGFYHELISTFSSITGESYMPNNTFGLFYGRNDTYTDAREVELGLKDPSHFGTVLKWKGKREMEWWGGGGDSDGWGEEEEDAKSGGGGGACNVIKGSDWNMFPPGITKEQELHIFSEEMCRSLKLVFESEIMLGGVKGLRFVVKESEFGDPRKVEDNLCYCTDQGEELENCPKDGAYQIAACSKGASILISRPHFLSGDAVYFNSTRGLSPEAERHKMFIDIEPTTGLVLRYSKRVQVNIHLKPLRKITGFEGVPNVIFPVMWADEGGVMKDRELAELKIKLRAGAAFVKPTTSLQLLGGLGDKHKFGFLFGGILLLPLVIFSVFSLSLRRKAEVEEDARVEDDDAEGEGEMKIMIT